MLGRRRRITRSKTDIKAQAGGMVGPYNTRGESAGFGPYATCRRVLAGLNGYVEVGNLATPH